jgi:hypothetical protein
MFVRFLFPMAFLALTFIAQSPANAVGFVLVWADNSDNEDGFTIERKTGVNGTFSRIASLGPDVTSYVDSGLADATAYCYRINAVNSAGNSAYSPEVCGTTPAVP